MNMHYSIAQFSLRELILSHQDVCASLNAACRRNGHSHRLAGVLQTRAFAIFLLEEDASGQDWEYVIEPFPGEEPADICGEIAARWQGSFSTRGQIVLEDKYLGVFEKQP